MRVLLSHANLQLVLSSAGYSSRKGGRIWAGLGRLIAVVLIASFLATSGAPCKASPASQLSVSSLDPCGHAQASPPGECAQLNCKTFVLPAAAFVGVLSTGAFVQTAKVAKRRADRMVRPPQPPPRASML